MCAQADVHPISDTHLAAGKSILLHFKSVGTANTIGHEQSRRPQESTSTPSGKAAIYRMRVWVPMTLLTMAALSCTVIKSPSACLCVRQGLRVHVQDGAEFVAAAAARVQQSLPDSKRYYDLAFIDTFDGSDDLPDSLFGPGRPSSYPRNCACSSTLSPCKQCIRLAASSTHHVLKLIIVIIRP